MVDFDRDEVVACLKLRGGDGVFKIGVFLVGNVTGVFVEGNGTVVDIAAEFLVAIEIDDRAVVAEEADGEGVKLAWIRDVKGMAEVGRGDELVVGIAVVDNLVFIAVAIAKLAGSSGPFGVVEGQILPSLTLVAAIIEITPDRSRGDESLRFCRAGRWDEVKMVRSGDGGGICSGERDHGEFGRWAGESREREGFADFAGKEFDGTGFDHGIIDGDLVVDVNRR